MAREIIKRLSRSVFLGKEIWDRAMQVEIERWMIGVEGEVERDCGGGGEGDFPRFELEAKKRVICHV